MCFIQGQLCLNLVSVMHCSWAQPRMSDFNGVFGLVLFGWGGHCPPVGKLTDPHSRVFLQVLFLLFVGSKTLSMVHEENTEHSRGRKINLICMKFMLYCPMFWMDPGILWMLLWALGCQHHHGNVRMPANEHVSSEDIHCQDNMRLDVGFDPTWAMLKLCTQSIPNQQVLCNLKNRVKCHIWADHAMAGSSKDTGHLGFCCRVFTHQKRSQCRII